MFKLRLYFVKRNLTIFSTFKRTIRVSLCDNAASLMQWSDAIKKGKFRISIDKKNKKVMCLWFNEILPILFNLHSVKKSKYEIQPN